MKALSQLAPDPSPADSPQRYSLPAHLSPQSVNRSLLSAQSRVGLSGGVVFAVVLHLAVIGAAIVLPRFFQQPPVLRRPIIAHMIALGKPRDQRLMPRKQMPVSVGISPTAPPAPRVASAEPAPSFSKGPSKPAKHVPTRAELMARALASVDRSAAREARAPDPDREGAADGSPTGNSATAEAGEKYYSAVHDAIQQNYVVPSVISEAERLYLSATMVVWIARDGTLLKHQLEKSSGNNFFDNALETAIARTRLPAPPLELARALADDGVGINFKP